MPECHTVKEETLGVFIFMDINGIQPCNMQEHLTKGVLPLLLSSTGLQVLSHARAKDMATEHRHVGCFVELLR